MGYLIGEDDLRLVSRVDAVGLQGNEELSAVLQVEVGVLSDDTGLVGLGDVSEDYVDHSHEEAVILRLTGIVNDGDDVGSLLGHVHKVTTDSVGKLHSVDDTGWADDIRDVRNGGP